MRPVRSATRSPVGRMGPLRAGKPNIVVLLPARTAKASRGETSGDPPPRRVHPLYRDKATR